jgi:serine/threonine-protein kinase RsbW
VEVVVAAGEVPSAYPRFVDVEAEGPCVVVAEQPPALVHEPFDHNVIAGVRHSVARLCASQGLAGQRLDDFVLAVNEMMTNAVRHAGGSGMLTLWCLDGTLRCEIADKGPGIPQPWFMSRSTTTSSPVCGIRSRDCAPARAWPVSVWMTSSWPSTR